MPFPSISDVPTQILLVEDNPGDANLIQEILSEVESADFCCQFADRLSAALEQLSSTSIDVAQLDLSLPDSNGLETLIKLRTWNPGLPIVALTGFEDETL